MYSRGDNYWKFGISKQLYLQSFENIYRRKSILPKQIFLSLHFLRSMSTNKITSKFRTSIIAPSNVLFKDFNATSERTSTQCVLVLRKLIIFCCPINFVYYEACTVAPCLSVTVKINSNLWPHFSISVKICNAYHDNLCPICWKNIFFFCDKY